jgi:hypothetical protein
MTGGGAGGGAVTRTGLPICCGRPLRARGAIDDQG